MGVEELGKFINDKVPHEKCYTSIVPGQAFSMLYDMNGCLYSVANDIYGLGDSLDGSKFDQRMDITEIRRKFKDNPEELHLKFMSKFKDVLTSNIIDIVKPTDVLIIGFDGIAPIAKIDQQRTRRFTSAEARKNHYENSRNKKDRRYDHIFDQEEYMFNTLLFTPGTDFMNRVCETVRTWISDNRSKLPPFLYFTDVSERGEAEHKIFKYFDIMIKQLTEAFKGEKNKRSTIDVFRLNAHVIMGLDSDLFFISLLRIDFAFYWIRSTNYGFKKKKTKVISKKSQKDFTYQPPDELTVIAIAGVRDFIIENMVSSDIKDKQDIYTLIQDFVLLSFHIGDDFVPAMFILNIDPGYIITELMKTYKMINETLIEDDPENKYPFRLTKNGDIIYYNLMIYYSLFKDKEEEIYNDKGLLQQYESEVKELKQNNLNTSIVLKNLNELRLKYRRENHKFEFENTMLLEGSYEDFVNLWPEIIVCPSMLTRQEISKKEEFYRSVLMKNIDSELDNICNNYFTGLQWNLSYYIGLDVNNWVYNYMFSPTINHLFSYLEKHHESTEDDEEGTFNFEIQNVLRVSSDNFIDPTQLIFTVMNVILSNEVVNGILHAGKKTIISKKSLQKEVDHGKITEKIPFYMSYVPISFGEFQGGRYHDKYKTRHGGYRLVPKIPKNIIFKLGVNSKILTNFPSGKLSNVDKDADFDVDNSIQGTFISSLKGGNITFGANEIKKITRKTNIKPDDDEEPIEKKQKDTKKFDKKHVKTYDNKQERRNVSIDKSDKKFGSSMVKRPIRIKPENSSGF